MHLAEGILPFKQALITSVAAAPILAYSALVLKRLHASEQGSVAARPFLTMAFALCFAVTLLPVPVPVAGASSHMCATPLLALILGLRVVPIVTALLLLVQALFFAHGGLTTLGANTLTLGIVGPSVTLGLYWFMKLLRISEKFNLIAACFVGSLAVYFGDSLLLAWGFADKQPFMTTFSAVTLGFLPVQGPLSLLEGFISAGVIVYLARQRSDFVPVRGFWRAPVASAVSLVTAALLVAGSFLASPADASSYEGLDDSLFNKTAESLGVQTKDLTPWISGEVELAVFSFGFLIAGFIAGRAFTEWRDECRSFTERVGVQIDAS